MEDTGRMPEDKLQKGRAGHFTKKRFGKPTKPGRSGTKTLLKTPGIQRDGSNTV